MMEADLRRRFWVALALTVPVLLLSPTIQHWFCIAIPGFVGYRYLLFGLATIGEAVPARVLAVALFQRFSARESASSIILILGSNVFASLRRLVGFMPTNSNGEHWCRGHV
jgi:Cu2+-exporting ATPase